MGFDLNGEKAVKEMNIDFFAYLFSINYWRKNRYFSINLQLQIRHGKRLRNELFSPFSHHP